MVVTDEPDAVVLTIDAAQDEEAVLTEFVAALREEPPLA
jgi:hypothetical protein